MSENKACSDARRVKVVIRTKPTAEFAHDQIELGKDGKVRNSPTNTVTYRYTL